MTRQAIGAAIRPAYAASHHCAVRHARRRAPIAGSSTSPSALHVSSAAAEYVALDEAGSVFPESHGYFFFENLRGTCIIRVVLDGRRVQRQERLLEEQYGRIRDIAEDPTGILYFSTSTVTGAELSARRRPYPIWRYGKNTGSRSAVI